MITFPTAMAFFNLKTLTFEKLREAYLEKLRSGNYSDRKEILKNYNFLMEMREKFPDFKPEEMHCGEKFLEFNSVLGKGIGEANFKCKCSRCLGKGYYTRIDYIESICIECQGVGTVRKTSICNGCYGSGIYTHSLGNRMKCVKCQGSGIFTHAYNITCKACKGKGRRLYKELGKVHILDLCFECHGFGEIEVQRPKTLGPFVIISS